MKIRHSLGAGLSLVSLAAGINSASAATSSLYSNLGPGEVSVSNTVGYLSNVQPNQLQAQGFTLGASDYNLTLLEFQLSAISTPAPVAQIYGDNSGSPGSPLATFTTSGAIGDLGIYSFTGSFAAQKNTNYWVVLSNANSASLISFEWYSNSGFSQPTQQNASGITYLGTKESNNGASWDDTLPSLSIRVSGTDAIPEPSSLALLGLGTVGLLTRRRTNCKA
jgi:hypothetical protein